MAALELFPTNLIPLRLKLSDERLVLGILLLRPRWAKTLSLLCFANYLAGSIHAEYPNKIKGLSLYGTLSYY